jgi:hypothetical protein
MKKAHNYQNMDIDKDTRIVHNDRMFRMGRDRFVCHT